MGPRPSFCVPRSFSLPTDGGNRKGKAHRTWRSRHAPQITSIFGIMTIEQEIKSHTQRVEAGERPCHYAACPGCDGKGPFRLHDCRRRTWRLVVDGCVQVVRSWILRWKCPGCGKRFTDYPPFCVAAQAICQTGFTGKSEGLPGYPVPRGICRPTSTPGTWPGDPYR